MASRTARDSERRRAHKGGRENPAQRAVKAASGSAGQFADYARDQVTHAAGRARGRVIDHLDDQRQALSSALEDAARGLEKAGRRSGSPLTRELMRTGDQALREVSARIDAGSVEEVLHAATQTIKRRPGLAIAGLLGVGALAGRAFRAGIDSKGRE